MNLKRKFIGFELDADNFAVAQKRLAEHETNMEAERISELFK